MLPPAEDRPEGGAGPSRPTPEVSVIVPVYQTAAFVGDAIASLRAQTFGDFEAIVVDDGSTDGGGDVARQAAGDDPRFVFLRQDNAGLSAARNTGLARARGRLIAFLDSDDRFDPDFLRIMRRALLDSGAAWAACAVRIVSPGGEGVASAIHGRPAAPGADDGWTRLPLDDWREVVPHWPSAWNKLYRRDLIGEVRFPVGLRYEDHPWFQALAARTDALTYVPRPLYLHRQGREGQITADGTDTVFEQFEILDRCAAIQRASERPGVEAGLARMASRVLHERAGTIPDADRRARFLAAGRDWLRANGLDWSPDWDPGIARAWGERLAGRLPLTVVIPVDGPGEGLSRSLAALSEQRLPDAQVLIAPADPAPGLRQALAAAIPAGLDATVLPDAADGVAAARNAGLAAAQGTFVTFLDAGDVPGPHCYWMWVEAMLRERADLGLSRFRTEGPGHAQVRTGCHDGRMPFGGPPPDPQGARPDWLAMTVGKAAPLPADRALALHAHPSAKIFRTAFLRAAGIAFPDEPLSAWDVAIRAALAAPRALPLPAPAMTVSMRPEDRRLWHAPRAAADLHAAVMRLAPALDPALGRQGWYPVLMARALWEKVNFAAYPDPDARDAVLADARALLAAKGAVADDDRLDAYVGPRIRALFPARTAAAPPAGGQGG